MLYIGIEGGGTKTKLLIQEGNNEPLFSEHAISLKFTGGKYKESAERLAVMLTKSISKDSSGEASVVIGLSGAGRVEDQELYRSALKEVLPFNNLTVQILSDAELTFRTAFGETAPGIVLIAGTGSVALIRNALGMMFRIGGWGKLIGDEGSGHCIGLAALRHLSRVIDQREEPDTFTSNLFAALPAVHLEPLKLSYLVESGAITPSELSPIVFASADQSSIARSIVESAASDLIRLLESAVHQLHGVYPIDVAINGSIITQPLILERITKALADKPIHFKAMDDNASVRKALALAREYRQPLW